MAKIERGIYHIVAADSVDSARLTRHGQDVVTILASGAAPEPEQEWEVVPLRDEHIIISVPSPNRPPSYLSWKGEPGNPEPGQTIVPHISQFGPIYEWHARVGFAPHRFFLHAASAELGIKALVEPSFPPVLVLTQSEQIQWLFELVREK